jgi:hypothetical protein
VTDTGILDEGTTSRKEYGMYEIIVVSLSVIMVGVVEKSS